MPEQATRTWEFASTQLGVCSGGYDCRLQTGGTRFPLAIRVVGVRPSRVFTYRCLSLRYERAVKFLQISPRFTDIIELFARACRLSPMHISLRGVKQGLEQ